MKKLTSVAVGAAVAVTLSTTINAAESPFGMQELSTGYNVAMSEGTCGEGKCGADKAKEAKCGGDKAKEAKCGAEKAKEAKCGGDKAKEAKCGAK